jgi:O-acetylhomoserine (thiol)-lyase
VRRAAGRNGTDVVVHSTTKYLNGHGAAVGGVVIDSGRFDWPEEKYPDFRSFKERKGDLAYLDRVWREIHINFGTSRAPFHSHLTLIGLDTLVCAWSGTRPTPSSWRNSWIGTRK